MYFITLMQNDIKYSAMKCFCFYNHAYNGLKHLEILD